MRILAIETSCDETAIAILECSGDPRKDGARFNVLSNIVLSQVALHAEYGGVFPSLAKREHSRNLVPVLIQALKKSGAENPKAQSPKPKQTLNSKTQKIPDTVYQILDTIFAREPELLSQFLEFIPTIKKPPIDAIAVTYGPGLEPALWVGVNFAKALALVWDVPIIPVNHMEGHLVSALLQAETRISNSKFLISNKIQNSKFKILNSNFPILALLVSGGHTELVLSKDWLQYEIVGETRDDAAGEAFDKVARMLGLGYPGGPAIAAGAAQWKSQIAKSKAQTNSKFQILNSKLRLPRPMIDSDNFDFSFSGLKTAVLYQLKKIPELTPDIVQEFAYEFQEAVTEVLVTKTIKAAQKYGARAILLGGGVSANSRLKEALEEKISTELDDVTFFAAPRELTGDNAVMIGVAAYLRHTLAPKKYPPETIRAEGTLRLA
ncbi:MAG: tRNA (adenosine(37)-N6)-threonylcarbamoyltransferase complex transferase subunit TsaD [Parcubacteria group bacterium]|nr:tRNA (adenosine(37)-N6)-threonylcarbamoyltransferase complex transferase subunit TsaD [Parcubacteria group bacterium]